MELIETSMFTRQITALLTDEEYGEFQTLLAANPQLGTVVTGGGGIREDPGGSWVTRQERRRARYLLLGCAPWFDFVALRVFQERHCGSDPEAGCPTRQGC